MYVYLIRYNQYKNTFTKDSIGLQLNINSLKGGLNNEYARYTR